MGGVDWTLLRGVIRGLQMAGSFVTFGTAFLTATLLYRQQLSGLRPIAWTSLAVALASGCGWFLLQTADFANATSFSDVVGALPIVAEDTRFGILLISRCAALTLATFCFQAGWPRSAALISFGAIVAESWLGHGGAMTGTIGTILLITSIIHLSGGAMWLGALPALRLAIKRLPVGAAATVAQRFSPIGIACVTALVLTAAIQFWLLIGRPEAFFTTEYGFTAFVKTLLLAGLIGLATINRQRLAPKLPVTRAWLVRSINTELVFGLLTLLAAGLILQLEPPTMASMATGQ
jgi:putative copper resistance protein D